jgi:hypothetical protein
MEFWQKTFANYAHSDVYNADETGFARFKTANWFVCPRGAARPRVAGKDYRDHVTMMCCVSSTGRVVPPMFIIAAGSEETYHAVLSRVTGAAVIATGSDARRGCTHPT